MPEYFLLHYIYLTAVITSYLIVPLQCSYTFSIHYVVLCCICTSVLLLLQIQLHKLL